MAVLALLVVSCGGDEAPDSGGGLPRFETISVIASMYPLEYFSERVGGDRVEVDGIVPSGGDAHAFEPTPGDLRNIANADLLVYNGLGFESWVEALLAAGDAPETTVQAGSETVARHFDIDEIGSDSGDGQGDGDLDPHIWLDPVLAITQVSAIRDGLIEVDPDGAALYRTNSDTLVAELEALDARFVTAFRTCSQDTFVTSHDSFNYLAARYGLTAVGIGGINPGAEPSPRALARLTDAITEAGISYVLVSPIDTEQLSDTVARESGVEILLLHALQNLTADERDSEEDYFSLMDVNLESLATALECDR
ncbi:MAG: zinc ABC transporter substrate-binding protein [Chloroflexi bacterium]|nr:zinc ABC transporter substrate-binding protein [Chloroflexota bacterium]